MEKKTPAYLKYLHGIQRKILHEIHEIRGKENSGGAQVSTRKTKEILHEIHEIRGKKLRSISCIYTEYKGKHYTRYTRYVGKIQRQKNAKNFDNGIFLKNEKV